MDHREMNTEETRRKRDELEGMKKRTKEFIGEKEMDNLNLSELIELQKRLETLKVRGKIPVGDMTLEPKDIIAMETYLKLRIRTLEDETTQDELDIIMVAFENKEGRVKGLKMRMKVIIDEKKAEDIHMLDLIEIYQKLDDLQPYKSVEAMRMKDMTKDAKDIIIMKEIVNKLIVKAASSKTKIIKEGRVKGLKMRMKVFINEKKSEDIYVDNLIEIYQKLKSLQPYKSVEKMRMKDMTEEIKDTIIMKDIVKKLIAKCRR